MSNVDLSEIGRDFTNFGVDTNLQKLKEEIQDRGLWDDFAEGDTGEAILEALAVTLAKANFKLYRLAQEAYPSIAQQRQSVIEGFKALGYNPPRREWSTVGLFFWLDSASGEDVVIPEKTEITHSDSSTKIFTLEDAIIPSGTPSNAQTIQSDVSSGSDVQIDVQDASIYEVNDVVEISDANNSEVINITDTDESNDTVTVSSLSNSYATADNAQIQEKPSVLLDCAQGSISQKQVTSQGTEDLSIHISSDIVAEDGVEVYVNPSGTVDENDEWTEVDTLLKASEVENEEAFEVEVRPDETIDVVFGNGQLGAIPPSGETVTVQYIETQGSDGVVFANDSINSLDSTIEDVTGSTVSNINVSNYDNDLTGGSDAPSTDRIRVEAPDQATSGDTAVTREDFVAIAQSYPSVLLANAEGERDVDPPNAEYADKVFLYIVREADASGNPQPLTNSFLYGTSATAGPGNADPDSFLGFLDSKDILGTANDVKEANLLHYFVESDVFIDGSTSPSDTVSAVENELDDFLLAENNVNLNIGKSIRESDVINRIEGIDRVLYSHTKLVQFAKGQVNASTKTFTLDDFNVSNVDYALNPPFERRSVEVVDPTGDVVGVDDGNGNLTATANANDFTGGSVDYEIPNSGDWEITVNFSQQVNKVFEFRFRTDDPRSGEDQRDGDIIADQRDFPLYISDQSDISAVFDN